MNSELKYKVDDKGLYLNPEKARKQARRKRKKIHEGDKYEYRRVDRICPKCGQKITKWRKVKKNKKLGIPYDMTLYICSCGSAWEKGQCRKLVERLKRNPKKNITNTEFKHNL